MPDYTSLHNLRFVMPALVAGIHGYKKPSSSNDVDGRDKPGHDGRKSVDCSESRDNAGGSLFASMIGAAAWVSAAWARVSTALSRRRTGRPRCLREGAQSIRAPAAGLGLLLCVLACILGLTEFAAADQLARLWDFPTASAQPQSLVADRSGKPCLYLAQKDRGLAVLDLSQPAVGPRVVAEVPVRMLGGLHAMNLAQDGDRLFVALGDFFAAGGSKAGLAIIDVSQPAQPRVMSLWTSATVVKGSAVVLASGRYAYLGAMREGVFIFDVSEPRTIVPVSAIQPDADFPRPRPNSVQHPNARGLALAGDLLFVAYDSGGIRVIDVTDKAKPREVARYLNRAMGNKQQAYNNIVIKGRLAYVAADYCGLEILDIGDPRAIRQLGWWNPWRCDAVSNIWLNSPGHTNQLVLDADRQLVFLSAGDAELQVVDVKNPAHPALAGQFGAPKDGRGTWGLTVAGRNVFLTYIKTLIPFRGTWAGVTALSR